MTRSIFAAAVVAALMSSAPAMAQKLPDGTTAQERADTAKLNAEQLAKADAETARYQQSVSQYEQHKAAIAEQTAAAQAMSLHPGVAWGTSHGSRVPPGTGGSQ